MFYGAGFLLSMAAVVVGILQMVAAVGLAFIGFLALTLAGLIGIVLLGSALLGLMRAQYLVDRNSLLLRWGRRVERIPIVDIEWVRTFDSLGLEMHVPRFYQLGIVRGIINQRELGTVEFLSDTVAQSIFIATQNRVYVVSPTEMDAFLTRIREAMESGSLMPTQALSVDQATVLEGIWQRPIGRLLLTALLVCNLALLAIVQLTVSTPNGVLAFQQQTVITVVSLNLMPYLSIAFGLLDLGLGIFFYQVRKQPQIAFVLWASGGVLPVLFALSILIVSM